MGIFSTLGSIAGSFFGPVGSTVGNLVGGAIDGSEERDYQEDKQQDANQYNSAEAALNREFQANQASLNRDFQERMSGSAYQRAMADMRLAGLNPMLAYSQGGATTPVGSMASGSQASYPVSAGAAFLQAENSSRMADAAAVSSEASASQAATSAKIGNETVLKIKEDVLNVHTDTARLKQVMHNLVEQRENMIREGRNLESQNKVLEATVSKVLAEVPMLRSVAFLNVAREQLTGLESTLKSFDVSAAEKSGNFGREAEQYRILIDILKVVIGGISSIRGR